MYLKNIPPEKAETLRWKLVESLENIGRKKKQSRSNMNKNKDQAKLKANHGVSKSADHIEEMKKEQPKGLVIGGRFQLGELLGKGGFAKVFKALDLKTGEQLAVKEIQKDLLNKAELPKILNEGKILAGLSHTNIVQFIELVQDKRQIYFVMEYVSGGSLYHTMKRFGVFPESLVCIYTAQTLLALEYLHAQNVLHRDIKGECAVFRFVFHLSV